MVLNINIDIVAIEVARVQTYIEYLIIMFLYIFMLSHLPSTRAWLMSSSSSSRAISLGVWPSTAKRLGNSAGLAPSHGTSFGPPHVGLEVLAKHRGDPPGGLTQR